MNLRSIFTIKELRQRVLFTLGILMIFRLGVVIPIPGINLDALNEYFLRQQSGVATSLISYLDFFAGGAFSRFSIFMLGVMPYITTSIIVQLLTVSFPSIKKIYEMEGGRRRMQKYTRYATVIVAIVQSFVVTIYARSISDAITLPFLQYSIIAMLTVTTGTMFLLWLGEQINLRGIGNGVSLIIFAGIVARMPQAIFSLMRLIRNGQLNPIYFLFVFVLFTGVVALVVIEQKGQRRIPVYYAKRVVGRKMYGAQNTYIPFRINPSGVIPVIFASSLMTFPLQILQGLGSNAPLLSKALYWFRPTGWLYIVMYVVLILFFAYFYTQVTLNPIEISKNIRENGGTIPGVRSENIEVYLMQVLNRIILPGGLFLAFIAVIPTLIQNFLGFPPQTAYLLGGTSMLILVGVDLDLMSQMDASQRMHHQGGHSKSKGIIKGRNL